MDNKIEKCIRTTPQQKQHLLLTPPEIADLLRVSLTTVYRLVNGRELPFYKVGQRLRFRRSDIDAYLAHQRVATIDQTAYVRA